MHRGEAPPQAGIGNDGVPDHRPGEIEGLGARRQHHQPVGDVGRGERHRHVDVTGEGQVVVDLVSDQQEVVRPAEIGQRLQFLRRQTRPPGFCGEQRTTIRSRPVSAASSASRSIP